MPYIPLIEHKRPRVLMLDFSLEDVTKIQKAGFEARRGASGLLDRKEFCFPFATQDVEVVFAEVRIGTFTSKEFTPSKDSVEESPFFQDLMREIWNKAGWVVLFISQNTSPEELSKIGIDSVGVISQSNHNIPESVRELLIEVSRQSEHFAHFKAQNLPQAQIPRFRGQAINTSEEAEAAIIARYAKTAKMSVLTCLNHPFDRRSTGNTPQPHILTFGETKSFKKLITDNSVDVNVLALKISNSVSVGWNSKGGGIYENGGILLLPDFGNNNCNVVLALLQEVFTETSPHLFDTPQHPWLEEYQAAPVLHLQNERQLIIDEALLRIEQLNKQIDAAREGYSWLLGLLVSKGDQFASNVVEALRFLDFEVKDVDSSLAPTERRREDFHIWDKADSYFAIGEAKTTGGSRGAAEEFITKTQNHQARYSRENNQAVPPALLIINYAIDLEPVHRAGRFYQDEIIERLEDSAITALSSVALFQMCQFVLEDKLSKESVRRFIANSKPLIPSIILEQLLA